ncbi:MAG TPA: hypothetical protein VFJ12_03175 [Segeticoccus sp.]|nr:hypothetical protein [Segeticoccus sp.]
MVRRALVGLGALAVLAAGVLLLVPLRADGVSGNAISPRYSDFGWFSYEPLPEHATIADLRAAGVRAPQDAVADRRREAAVTAAAGATLLGTGVLLHRRRLG